MKLATTHIQQFNSELGNLVDPQSTYIYSRSRVLAYLVDDPRTARSPLSPSRTREVGPRPQDSKGDLKTPESPDGRRNPVATPSTATR